jgi:hypothetical protein
LTGLKLWYNKGVVMAAKPAPWNIWQKVVKDMNAKYHAKEQQLIELLKQFSLAEIERLVKESRRK